MKKRSILSTCLIIVLIVIFAFSVVHADKYFDKYYQPGEYIIDMTEEEKLETNHLIEDTLLASEGSSVRLGIEHETIQEQHNRYQEMLSEGFEQTPFVFDDIGEYLWIPGIPDEKCIPFQDAWTIALLYLSKEEGIPDQELKLRIPQASFEIGNPDAPIWKLIFVSFVEDGASHYEVCIYAHDGSVQGYKSETPVG